MDYKNIGLRVGLEIHHSLQLSNNQKLFCSCPCLLKTNERPDFLLERQHIAVSGETGKIDEAALSEMSKKKKIIYEVYEDCNCLVETDDEPPHLPQKEAIEIALTISELLHCKPVDEIHVMRKTIVDGSLPSGFQRTMLIGTNGWVETSLGKVQIETVVLEEDSGRMVGKDEKTITFRLDRLGVPEIEIATGEGIISPEHARETAKVIGDVIRSAGKAMIREGSVRQDVNVSIKGGDRVEIKLIPSLSFIPLMIQKEIERQKSLIEKGKRVSREVRRFLEDGSTEFMRPLPGAFRMYPETDCFPIQTAPILKEVRKKLPKTFSERIEDYKRMGLSEEIAKQLIDSPFAHYFDKLVPMFKIEPSIMANVFVNILKDLERREKLNPMELVEKDFCELFDFLARGKVTKESVLDILKLRLSEKISIPECVEKLGIKTLAQDEIRKIVKNIVKKNEGSPKEKIIGFAMSQLRGKASPQTVIKIVEEELSS